MGAVKIVSFCFLWALLSCKKETIKPERVIVAEKVSNELRQRNISKVQVYQWYPVGYTSISGYVDFTVDDGYLIFQDKGGATTYMSFDRLTTFRFYSSSAELYFGF